MKRSIRVVFAVLSVFCLIALVEVCYWHIRLPNEYKVTRGHSLWLSEDLQAVRLTDDASVKSVQIIKENDYETVIKWKGIVPVKTVSVEVVERSVVTVGGQPFGVKLYADGVMVVSLSEVDTKSGKSSPAQKSGIVAGDVIVSVNGKKIYTNNELAHIVENCGGKPLEVSVRRDAVISEVMLQPERSVSENKYKIGMWVRDSSAGIGTVTFYHPQTRMLAGLGHPICDVDTGEIIPISGGEIVPARIFGVTKSKAGIPGELRGGFEPGTLGTLSKNDTTGVYALMPNGMVGESYEVAMKQEITEGDAQILTTVDGKRPQWYNVKIRKINYRDPSATRNMILEITDQALLDKTGGIVQGMSGSPLLQNGKLIGAVTHVLIDDPTKGYAIFAENMLETAQSVAEEKLKEAS